MKHTAWGLSENSSYKVVALLITLILWVIILGSKEATVIKMIEADYILPRDFTVTNSVPREVAFRVSGPRLALKKFSEVKEPLTIDLTSANEGLTTVRIHPDSINVPPGLRVMTVSPSVITPKLERIITKSIPIEVQIQGRLPAKRKLVHFSVEPPFSDLTGPRSLVENTKVIKTQRLDLSEIDSSTIQDLSLEPVEPGIIRSGDGKVKVSLTVK